MPSAFREGEVVPRAIPSVERADQMLVQQRLHLIGADLDDVGLKPPGALPAASLIGRRWPSRSSVRIASVTGSIISGRTLSS